MPKAAKSPESFETALAELEALIAGMESGQLSLEDSLAAYQRGSALLQYCQSKLADVQQRVSLLENDTLRPIPRDEEI